ncbi:MAG: glycogen debranching enzyme family protein [Chloroflexi bacterium]|nr:glycogen debranching enzyme family protein [Chloroflexota bacterium]
MGIQFGRSITGEFNQATRREWLVTNGTGGYAMGTVAMARIRRYHSLLTVALEPPTHRYLLVAALDAWVEINNRRVPLITHDWVAGVVIPDGYRNLEQFLLEGNIPVFRWAVGGVQIEQRIWMAHGENTTYVTWHYTHGPQPVRLIIKPLVTYRSHHDRTKGGSTFTVNISPSVWKNGITLDILPKEDAGSTPAPDSLPFPFRIVTNGGSLTPNNEWWWSFRLISEGARGLNEEEALFKTGTIEAVLSVGQPLAIACTLEEKTPIEWEEALKIERERQKYLLKVAQVDGNEDDKKAPAWIQQLVLAADQFLVQQADDRGTHPAIAAGYPWFTVWTRVVMMALPGLTLATGRHEIAAKILQAYAHHFNQGMLPNYWADEYDKALDYNTVDASLWYFLAVWAYHQSVPADMALIEALYPVLREAIDWYFKGTRFHIHVDAADGLLFAGEKTIKSEKSSTATQLTWMDVKIGGKALTPRVGKPVEVNALWINALLIMQHLAEKLAEYDEAERYKTHAQRAIESFNKRFWSALKGWMYDVIDGPGAAVGELINDDTLRPNQLLALSLPFRVLQDAEKSKQVMDVCARELLTSHGLRTLGRDEADYIGKYNGPDEQRDLAYHQGTVWGWLIGPFISAHYAVYQDQATALSFLRPYEDLIQDHGVGTLSEVFDGDAPFTPHGSVAHAASVAEVLRVWHELG